VGKDRHRRRQRPDRVDRAALSETVVAVVADEGNNHSAACRSRSRLTGWRQCLWPGSATSLPIPTVVAGTLTLNGRQCEQCRDRNASNNAGLLPASASDERLEIIRTVVSGVADNSNQPVLASPLCRSHE
jgi:hypothetical protein